MWRSVDLAGAVRAEQAGDPGPQRERDVVDGHDVAVPARDVIHLEGGIGVRRGRAHGPRQAGRRQAGRGRGAGVGSASGGGVVGSVMPRSAGSDGP